MQKHWVQKAGVNIHNVCCLCWRLFPVLNQVVWLQRSTLRKILASFQQHRGIWDEMQRVPVLDCNSQKYWYDIKNIKQKMNILEDLYFETLHQICIKLGRDNAWVVQSTKLLGWCSTRSRLNLRRFLWRARNFFKILQLVKRVSKTCMDYSKNVNFVFVSILPFNLLFNKMSWGVKTLPAWQFRPWLQSWLIVTDSTLSVKAKWKFPIRSRTQPESKLIRFCISCDVEESCINMCHLRKVIAFAELSVQVVEKSEVHQRMYLL